MDGHLELPAQQRRALDRLQGSGVAVIVGAAVALTACAAPVAGAAPPPGASANIAAEATAAAGVPPARRGTLQCTGRYTPPGVFGTYEYALAEAPEHTPNGLQVARQRALANLLKKLCPDGRGCDELRRFATAWTWGRNHGQWCYVYLVESKKLDAWIAGQTDQHLLASLRREVRQLLAGLPPRATVAVQPVFDATRNREAGTRGRFLAVRIAREVQLGGWHTRMIDPADGADTRPGDAALMRTRIIDVHTQRRAGVELHITADLLRQGAPASSREGQPIHVRAAVLPDPPVGPVARRGTLLLLRCRSTPAGACPTHDAHPVVARLRKVAADAGMAVSAVAISEPGAPRGSADATRRGVMAGVARVLEVSLSVRYEAEQDGVLYAFAACSANLVETASGRSVKAMSCDPEAKGAVYAKVGALRKQPVDAAKDAVRSAVEQVVEQVGWWKP